ncbi:hypothetical protein VTK73DRAFT_6153 [Phialemonium thermophilum]|uniref:Uncharacterized protein n=1 Tax=Phialemonium thermophilum TaxID=223376 RepID=A0ABR3WKQ5_9PEZI
MRAARALNDGIWGIGDCTNLDRRKQMNHLGMQVEVLSFNLRNALRQRTGPLLAYHPPPHDVLFMRLGGRAGIGQMPELLAGDVPKVFEGTLTPELARAWLGEQLRSWSGQGGGG